MSKGRMATLKRRLVHLRTRRRRVIKSRCSSRPSGTGLGSTLLMGAVAYGIVKAANAIFVVLEPTQ
jgi:hypothetical protein